MDEKLIMRIYTIGHSTRAIEDFIDILKHYQIELVVDVRKFPSSRKFPYFNRENLEKELSAKQIEYLHYPELGGFRKGGYEAFTKTEEFSSAINKLLELVDDKISVVLCAERFFWRCHRKYIANQLSNIGHQVTHIFDKENTQEHKSKEMEDKMKVKIFCDKK